MVGLWGFAPSEFRQMTMREFWCIYDVRIGEQRYGPLRESDCEELYETLMSAIENEQEGEC